MGKGKGKTGSTGPRRSRYQRVPDRFESDAEDLDAEEEGADED